MTAVEQNSVLLVELDAALAPIATRLRTLGLPVATVNDPEAAEEIVRQGRVLSLVAIDDDVGTEKGTAIITAVKTLFPDVPVVWTSHVNAQAADFAPFAPDAILRHPFPIEELQRECERLLKRTFYPEKIATNLNEAICTVLAGTFGTEGRITETFLRTNRNVLAYVNGLLPFAGPRVTGRLCVSASKTYLGEIRRRMFPSAPAATMSDAEDLAGEMCNQILGHLKGFLSRFGLPIDFGLPILIRGQQAEIRYKAANPSLVYVFEDSKGTLYIEFCLDIFSHDDLKSELHEAVPQGGTFMFL